jgi:hypothetical protein
MTLLGLPWGPSASWNAAGQCFVTLAALEALLAACSFFLLLRAGLTPLHLAIASVTALAALGPFPPGSHAHSSATGFLADSLFAWSAFAAALLLPYEATSPAPSVRDGLVRGMLWGAILSLGAITKVSFFYFLALVVPILLVIRIRHGGVRTALAALISLGVCSVPVAIYWLRYGLPALQNAWSASFGHHAVAEYVPLSRFLIDTLRESPGVLLPGLVTLAGIGYVLLGRRGAAWGAAVWPLLIIGGYCAIALASSNRQIRFLYPAIIAPPFLTGMLMSRQASVPPRRHAALAAVLVFCGLAVASVPTLHRANRHSIHAPEAVLAAAIEANARRIVLATDSSSLNWDLMMLAMEVSPGPPVEVANLAWRAADGAPVEDDFRTIDGSDLVVFQSSEALDVRVTNQRVPEYEQHARERFGNAPIEILDGVRIYGRRR